MSADAPVGEAPAPASSGGEPASPTPPSPPPAPSEPDLPPAAAPASSWKDGLSADFRNHPSLQDIGSVDDLTKSFIHAQSLLGTNRLQKPSEDWTQEQYEAFYKEIGVPETVEGYGNLDQLELPPIEGAQEMVGQFKNVFKYANLTPQQAEMVTKAYTDMMSTQTQNMGQMAEQAVTTTTQELQREWGNAYEGKLEQANEAAEAIFGDNLETFRQIRLADGTFLGDSSLMVKLLAAVGDSMGEGGLPGGGSRATLTPDEATAELRALEADTEARAAWLDANHPRHKEILERRMQLRRMSGASPTVEKDLFAPQGF
jgi:hypothetical protein